MQSQTPYERTKKGGRRQLLYYSSMLPRILFEATGQVLHYQQLVRWIFCCCGCCCCCCCCCELALHEARSEFVAVTFATSGFREKKLKRRNRFSNAPWKDSCQWRKTRMVEIWSIWKEGMIMEETLDVDHWLARSILAYICFLNCITWFWNKVSLAMIDLQVRMEKIKSLPMKAMKWDK